MAELFCNGGAMRGGNLHHNVSAHTFLGTVRTAPKYRFFSVRDEFPALLLAETGGAAIEGELYDVPIGDIRTDFLPEEPEELELTVIELSDGRSVLAVGLRPGSSGAEPTSSARSPITAAGDAIAACPSPTTPQSPEHPESGRTTDGYLGLHPELLDPAHRRATPAAPAGCPRRRIRRRRILVALSTPPYRGKATSTRSWPRSRTPECSSPG